MTRRWLPAVLLAVVWVVFGSLLSALSANSAAAYAYDGTRQLSSQMNVPPLVAPLVGVAASRSVVVAAAKSVAAAKTGFAAEASSPSVSRIGAAHVDDEAFSRGLGDLLQETLAGKRNFTSRYMVSGSEALSAGEAFLGEGYTELGQSGSGVFRSADQLRQFRMDPGSLGGDHAPFVPHVHFEVFDTPGAARPFINNHVPFYDDEFWMGLP